MTPIPYALDLWRDENPMPVVAYATCRRVSGEPGSLSIASGYEIDIARVTFRGNQIDISPAERADIEREILNIAMSNQVQSGHESKS